jgi:hypothetical protein
VICDSTARTASQSLIQRIPLPPAAGDGESPDIIGSSRMLAGRRRCGGAGVAFAGGGLLLR